MKSEFWHQSNIKMSSVIKRPSLKTHQETYVSLWKSPIMVIYCKESKNTRKIEVNSQKSKYGICSFKLLEV